VLQYLKGKGHLDVSKNTQLYEEYKHSLFVIDQKELTGGAKFLLGIFVITVVIIIGWGLSWQTAQTKSPYQQFGYKCKKLVDRTEPITFGELESEYRLYKNGIKHIGRLEKFGDDPQCKKLESYWVAIYADPAFRDAITKLTQLRKSQKQVQYQIRRLKSNYSDMLLEKVVGQDLNKSILPSSASRASSDLKAAEQKLAQLKMQIKNLENLNAYDSYRNFDSYYRANKEQIAKHYRSAERYYHFKRTMQAFGFLIPIWLLFYLFYRAMVNRRHFILSHLTLHVANVAALYALYYLILFIYDIIPKLFFQKIIEFFMQYNMAIVLNILAILFFITLFGIIIYRVQKNDTTGSKKRKQELQNIKMGRCSECGCVINDDYCPVCGFKHYAECPACHQKTLAKGRCL
jgi:hypothetical protein